MKIIADENIPLVKHYFGKSGEIILKPGRTIQHDDIVDADILLVRSVTPIISKLLQNTKIQFVGSTTIGFDHIDTHWLDSHHIPWAIAKGSNATAVVEYVISVVAALQSQDFLSKPNMRAGVIGVGEIGSQVASHLKQLGFEVIQNDPFRAAAENDFHSTPLDHFSDCDLVTLHIPLTTDGPYPTHHLIEKNFLTRLKSECVLLNSSRGSVINFSDLKKYGGHLHWCLDVWENEPNIDLDVLKKALIATPHIAGYSVQSKYRGIQMIYQAALQQNIISPPEIIAPPFPTKTLVITPSANWRDKALAIFNPLTTSQQMKHALLNDTETFDDLRKHFPERFEFDFIKWC